MKERSINYSVLINATWPVAEHPLEKLFTMRFFQCSLVSLSANEVRIVPATIQCRDLLRSVGANKLSKAWWRIPKDIITSLIITAV